MTYRDVLAFHDRFRLPRATKASPLLALAWGPERLRHLKEELKEYQAAVLANDVAAQADALVDIVYIAIGNAIAQGLPWDPIWAAVHAANMAKEPDPTVAKLIRKPPGWRAPDVAAIIRTQEGINEWLR